MFFAPLFAQDLAEVFACRELCYQLCYQLFSCLRRPVSCRQACAVNAASERRSGYLSSAFAEELAAQ